MEKKEQEQLQPEDTEQDIVFGLEDAGKVLGITPGRVDQLIHEGKLKAYDMGVGKQRGRWAFRRDDLEAVLGLEQTARGHRKHRGSIDEKYVFPLEAARLLGVDYDEVMYQVERKELQTPFVVKRNDRTVVAILSSSVQELMEKRRFVMTHDPLQYPLLDLWQVAEVINVDVKGVRNLVKESKLMMLNITPKGPYQIWRIVTSSLKQYMQEQAALQSAYFSTLEEAATALGVTGERVRQLIGEKKLEAIDRRSPGSANARWFVSRSSAQRLREQHQEDL